MPSCRHEIATWNMLEANGKASSVVSQDDTTRLYNEKSTISKVGSPKIYRKCGMYGVNPVFLARSYLPEAHQRTGMLECTVVCGSAGLLYRMHTGPSHVHHQKIGRTFLKQS